MRCALPVGETHLTLEHTDIVACRVFGDKTRAAGDAPYTVIFDEIVVPSPAKMNTVKSRICH